MSEVQRLQVEVEGETYEIYIESKENPTMPEVSPPLNSEYDESEYEREDSYSPTLKHIGVQMQDYRQMIRGYTLYMISAFKNFPLANVEELKFKFGIKIAAQTGLPFIAQASTDCIAEIEVKLTFPDETEKRSP